MSRRPSIRARRATSKSRSSWLAALLMCTGRNQPVRIICAMPRASLRSVLLRIAASAVCMCRVSTHTTGKPALPSPSCSHDDIGPASCPTRSKVRPVLPSQAAMTSGSVASDRSFTILPASSTMQTDVVFTETSNPT
jgi:hypothetical protein